MERDRSSGESHGQSEAERVLSPMPSFEEHMGKLGGSSLSTGERGAVGSKEKHDEDVAEARSAVLKFFEKEGNGEGDNERITNCKNRVFETKLGPRYEGNPNVFRTNEKSVYRITGMNQITDIVNCGYVRPKEGKLKGGHENEVFWSVGGDKLNFIDERPILETSVEAVKDGQIGAVSLKDLTGIWVVDKGSGKRENMLESVKRVRESMGKDEKISADDLTKRMGTRA